jgi:Domain of unknown function (DUF4276)
MVQIVVMVEEPSMKIVVRSIAAKLGLFDQTIILQHQGKSDLESSFPHKLKAWTHPTPTRFIICRDNDGSDCSALKTRLDGMAKTAANHEYRIRIVVNELESWYLGDLKALEAAGVIKTGEAHRLARKAKFRDPEKLTNAKQEFLRFAKASGQMKLAALIGPHLNLDDNTSKSFGHFVGALKWASA